MARVVYLFGAGASFEDGYGLPLQAEVLIKGTNCRVSGLQRQMEQLISYGLDTNLMNLTIYNNWQIRKFEEYETIRNDFQSLSTSKGFGTIDQYANFHRNRHTKNY
jgi:uncharacterized membrane protein YkvI